MAEKRGPAAAAGQGGPDLSSLVGEAVEALRRLNDTLQGVEDRLESGAPARAASVVAAPAAPPAITGDVATAEDVLATFEVALGLNLIAVTALSPTTGPVGQAVDISGANFGRGATVRFGAEPATRVDFVSGTLIRATAPPGGHGQVDVTVTAANEAFLPGAFTYTSFSKSGP